MENKTVAAALIEAEAQKIQAALAMVGLQFDLETSWLIYKTMVAYEEKKGDLSVSDAVFIYVSNRKIFQKINLDKTDEYSI